VAVDAHRESKLQHEINKLDEKYNSVKNKILHNQYQRHNDRMKKHNSHAAFISI
jgi:FtsZ-binding cell division protein ZapB